MLIPAMKNKRKTEENNIHKIRLQKIKTRLLSIVVDSFSLSLPSPLILSLSKTRHIGLLLPPQLHSAALLVLGGARV